MVYYRLLFPGPHIRNCHSAMPSINLVASPCIRNFLLVFALFSFWSKTPIRADSKDVVFEDIFSDASSLPPIIQLPLRIVQITDSNGVSDLDGNDHTILTPTVAAALVQKVNENYEEARIQFTFDPKDLEIRKSDHLLADFAPVPADTVLTDPNAKPPQPNSAKYDEEYDALGDERSDRLTIIVHQGSSWYWNPKTQTWTLWFGASHGAFRSVRVTTLEPIIWSHELGHCLGLLHISRDGSTNPSKMKTEADVSAACAQYLAQGGDPAHPEYAIDGDYMVGIRDTLPDPGIGFWTATKAMTETLNIVIPGRQPFPMTVSRNNIMAPAGPRGSFTADQNLAMRSVAQSWAAGGGGYAHNTRPANAEIFGNGNRTYLSGPIVNWKRRLLAPPDQAVIYDEFELGIGEQVSFKFQLKKGGLLVPSLCGTMGTRQGKAQVQIDGKAVGKFDFWGPFPARNRPTGWHNFAPLDLQAGPHTFTLIGIAGHPLSTGRLVGLDALSFTPVP